MTWPVVQFDEVCTFENGDRGKNYPNKSEMIEVGVPFVNAGDLTDGALNSHGLSFISTEHYDRLSNGKFKRGDFLFCLRGTLGKFAFIDRNIQGAIASSLIIIRPKKSKIDPAFLNSYLRSDLCAKQIALFENGAAQPNLSAASLRKFEIPLPPLEEQKRIAAILDQADALRRLRARALTRLNALGQAIFHEMFGDGCQVASVSDLLSDGKLLVVKDGNHGSNYPRKEDFGTEGVPFLSAKDINDDGALLGDEILHLSHKKAATLKIGKITNGDVLLSHNASVGKVALYDGRFGEAIIGTSLTCYRPNRSAFSPTFLFLAMRSSFFQEQLSKNMGQTTRNQVPITAQRGLMLPAPSIERQLEIEARLAATFPLINYQAVAASKTETLFTSLQHRAFRGEL